MGICSSRKFSLRTHANVCQDAKRLCLCDSGSIKRTCQQCSFFLNVDHESFLWIPIPHRSYFSRQAKKDHFGISAFLAVHLMLAMLSPIGCGWASTGKILRQSRRLDVPCPASSLELPRLLATPSRTSWWTVKVMGMMKHGWLLQYVVLRMTHSKSINKNIQSIIHEATTNIFNVAFYLALRLYLP